MRERRAVAIRDSVLPLVRSKGQKHHYGCAGVAGPCHLTTWEDGPFRFVLREPYRPLGAGLSDDALNASAMPRRGADPVGAGSALRAPDVSRALESTRSSAQRPPRQGTPAGRPGFGRARYGLS